MSWPFFIYNNEILHKKNKQEQEQRRKDAINKLIEENPNFYLDSYDLDKIWNADNVMRVLESTSKKSIPVYKIELDKKIKNLDRSEYWVTTQVLVGYKDI